MKPEIQKEWQDALSRLRNAQKLYDHQEFQEGEKDADAAILLAIHAIGALAKELELHDLSEIQANALLELLERRCRDLGGKHYGPKANIEWAKETLERLSKELPPDTLRPLQ